MKRSLRFFTLFLMMLPMEVWGQCPIEINTTIFGNCQCKQIAVLPSGGVPPYFYSADGTTFTNNNIVHACPGLITIMVQDSEGTLCSEELEIDDTGFWTQIYDYENPSIDAPLPVCIPSNGSVILNASAVLSGLPNGGTFNWTGQPSSNSGIFEITEPGTYCVTVTNNVTGCSAVDCITLGQFPAEIQTIAGNICPNADSLNATCQKVCTNTEVTYQIADAEDYHVEWTVEGTDNYEQNGNQVTVNWGEAGFGEVTGLVAEIDTSAQPLQVFCGESNSNGEGFVKTIGGTPDFQYSLNGNFIIETNEDFYEFNGLSDGFHVVTVMDNAGQSSSCEFSIQQNCIASFYPIMIPPIATSSCDGILVLVNIGEVEGTILKDSDGNTLNGSPFGYASTISNLCCGDYTLTVITDFFNPMCGSGIYEYELNIPCYSTCYGEATQCVEILQDPLASFTTNPPATNGVIDICRGETVTFQNQSNDAGTFIWDFGDLTNSVLNSPTHTYLNAGQYTVKMVARNDCFCADTTTVLVNVTDLDIPEIECVGTVCKGDAVTYSVAAECSAYNWAITGDASIVEGGTPSDNFITVLWNEGPEGTVDLSVTNCNPMICDATATARIPILTDDISVIEGLDKVCPGEIATYMIPDFGGTEFSWTVIGGNILEGQNTHQIIVEWDESAFGNHSVSVNYDNCFLECGGSDFLSVTIKNEFYLDGPLLVCENETVEYFSKFIASNGNVNADWSLIDNNGMTVFTESSTSNLMLEMTFPAGNYRLQATPVSVSFVCNLLFEIPIEILPAPPPPTAIIGATEICPSQTYTYIANGLPAHEFHWTINKGGTITEAVGDQINVTWSFFNNQSLTLTQIANTGLQCESPPITVDIMKINEIEITGTPEICREETSIFTASSFQNINYDWQITPSDAGTIINGDNSNSIEIFWHSTGNHTVSAGVCSENETFAVTVFDLPQPTVLHPEILCSSEMAIVSLAANFTDFDWKNEAGNTISNDENPELPPGYHEVIVTDENGCTGNAIFEIKTHPEPNILIDTPSNLGICDSNPIILFATETEAGYTFQWLQNGQAIGTDAPTLDILNGGIYQVQITDTNGCTATSNELIFGDCEAGGGMCVNGICFGGEFGIPIDTTTNNPPPPPMGDDCSEDALVNFTISPTNDCNIFAFQNTSTDYVVGSLDWNFDDPNSNDNYSELENPTHVFTQVGFYDVGLFAQLLDDNGEACGFGYRRKMLTVPAVADFEYFAACLGEPIEFIDNSTFLPEEITAITAWNWNFGDPASGANNTSNLPNPSHIFPDESEYLVTLTITTAEGCISTIQKAVSVNAKPEISFTPPVSNCQNTEIDFVFNNLNGQNITEVAWNFGDPMSNDANTSFKPNTVHIFQNMGEFAVSVTATNIYGCTEIFTENITIAPNNLNGIIEPQNPDPICEGENLDLTINTNAALIQWSNGQQTPMITVNQVGNYGVTLTDLQGCTFVPPPVFVEIIPAPVGTIQAVEYNDFDQATAYFDNEYAICEGEEVHLLAQSSTEYTFEWSTGDTGNEISFTDDKDNLLTTGTYQYDVTITNETTGCTAVAEPFIVEVHPTPNEVTITSNPSGPLCNGTAANLSVENPDPTLIYVWNTGELATQIQALAAGEYFVRAINDFGCEGKSNSIQIENAPNIRSVPTGCHVSCLPDTICLPNIPNVVDYQWFMDGVPIASPQGTVKDLVILESGHYTLQMTDAFGCVAVSDAISMTGLPGFGDILGGIYFDVNENGVIDAADTLVSNMEIFLTENGLVLDTFLSNENGFYGFVNQGASDAYSVLLNTNLLPPNWAAYQPLQNTMIAGCDVENTLNFLLFENCQPTQSTLVLEICPNTGIEYEGVFLAIGQTQDFILENTEGCDSVVTVSVNALPENTGNLELVTCENSTITYHGMELSAGQQMDFVLENQFGCDSVVTVSVGGLPTNLEVVNLEICEGTTAVFQGFEFEIGDTETFILGNQFGCDSTINLTVNGLPNTASSLNLQACDNEAVFYQGQGMIAGQTQDFILQNANGCDSTVTVSVTQYPEITFEVETTEACFNENNGTIQLIDIQGDTTTASYIISGVTILQNEPFFDNLPAGEYPVFLRDQYGCVYLEAATIEEIPPLEITTEDAIIDCNEAGVSLAPTIENADAENLFWEWSTGETTPSIFTENTGNFTVNISNECETITRNIAVNYAIDNRENFIFIPNVFSPNGDMVNDEMGVYFAENVKVLDFTWRIFDRWGNLCFEATNVDATWDGRFRGKMRNSAVFAYYLEARVVACGQVREIFEEGDVVILR